MPFLVFCRVCTLGGGGPGSLWLHTSMIRGLCVPFCAVTLESAVAELELV